MPIRNNFNGLLYYCWQQCLVRALYSQVALKLYSWMNSNRYYVVLRLNFMYKVMCCAIPYFKDDEVFCKWYAISLDNFLQNIPIYFILMASWPKGFVFFVPTWEDAKKSLRCTTKLPIRKTHAEFANYHCMQCHKTKSK